MALPRDLWLDHSGSHYRKHSSPPIDQIFRATLVVDAASCHCFEHCFSSVTRLLEICAEPLFQCELVMLLLELSRQEGVAHCYRVRFCLGIEASFRPRKIFDRIRLRRL